MANPGDPPTLLQLVQDNLLTEENLNFFMNYGVLVSINYGSQIGASFVLLVVLLLLTRPEKRMTAVFGLNSISLALNVVRSVLQCLYLTGPFYTMLPLFAADYSQIPISQYRISVAGVCLTFLLVLCLQASLVLQVRAVCVTISQSMKYLIMAASTVIASVAVAFHLGLTIQDTRTILSTESSYRSVWWLEAAASYSLAGSICFFSFIFVAKLAAALRQRRKLGLSQFGPMQIIFIMGAQTLVIPATFSVITNVAVDLPTLGSQVITLVVIFLPLSSMWASTSVHGDSDGSSYTSSARKKLFGGSGSVSSSQNSNNSTGHLMANRNIPLSRSSATTNNVDRISPMIDEDLEAADRKIHVGRSVPVTGEGY